MISLLTQYLPSYNELSHITKYTSSYRAQTDELVDITIINHDNYIILDASIVENGKEKVVKQINSTIYENDLQDLLVDIEDVLMHVEEHIKEVNDCIGTKGKMNKKLRNLQKMFLTT